MDYARTECRLITHAFYLRIALQEPISECWIDLPFICAGVMSEPSDGLIHRQEIFVFVNYGWILHVLLKHIIRPAYASLLREIRFYNARSSLTKSNVGMEGIEPSTSVLSGQRSTTELHARI